MTNARFTRFGFVKKTPIFVQQSSGFTMIEILIVVAIVALVATAMMVGLNLQGAKARDARRKADLEKLKIVFEHYYDDNDCYPPENVFFNGGGAPSAAVCSQAPAALTPYLKTVPCDPTTGMPYYYVAPVGNTICNGYRLYTRLENTNDNSITAAGCTKTGCGVSEPYASHNFGIAVGAAVPE